MSNADKQELWEAEQHVKTKNNINLIGLIEVVAIVFVWLLLTNAIVELINVHQLKNYCVSCEEQKK